MLYTTSKMEFDRTLLTDNYLIDVVTCIENHGYTVEDFEFTTQRTQGYKKGKLDPKDIVYASRLSTGIEKSYILGEDANFSKEFCSDLHSGFFERHINPNLFD